MAVRSLSDVDDLREALAHASAAPVRDWAWIDSLLDQLAEFHKVTPAPR